MKAIGGYFELADYEEGRGFPHQDGVLLNTGRNALEYILRCVGEIKGIYLPYYTCEVVLEPLRKLHIPWVFYHINANFEMVEDIRPKEGEYIIANNYFGIKDAYIQTLAEKYGDHLIVDCAQAYFAKPIPGIKAFYSTRKYVGVADGGVAYLGNLSDSLLEVDEIENTDEHNSHLFKRKQFGAEAGYSDFQMNEKKLDNQPIRKMSFCTKWILEHIDYERVIDIRKRNYQYLDEALAEFNQLSLPSSDSFICPMVYPFKNNSSQILRHLLIKDKVFVAKYWPNIELYEDFEEEFDFANTVIPVPCDQRYGIEDMDKIIKLITKNIQR